MKATVTAIHALLFYCRTGFERECAKDVQAQVPIHEGEMQLNTGFLIYLHDKFNNLAKNIQFRQLIFARQMIALTHFIQNLPPKDRITPLLEILTTSELPTKFSDVLVETADTNEAKEMLNFCSAFTHPLIQALRRINRLDNQSELPRLHLLFIDSSQVYVGFSHYHNASPWFMGIPRLKFPKNAPSRSVLKLEEAFHHFLTPRERDIRLCAGLRAVDLGAAPGGWSWLLAQRGMRVIAVDNGPLAPSLLESGLVQHLRVDGFRYAPKSPVDWMTCDIVEQPRRIAKLVAQWMAKGWCQACIFNLKLPMKKRYEEIQLCKELIQTTLASHNIRYQLEFKQLYHDREEVTGYWRRQ
jgi:23S rRNA (cytidine2498-2'-O)-methyltransferase